MSRRLFISLWQETQDLLHQIEFGKYAERDKFATKLARVYILILKRSKLNMWYIVAFVVGLIIGLSPLDKLYGYN